MASIKFNLAVHETVVDREEEVLKSLTLDGYTGDFTAIFEITKLDGGGAGDPDNKREYTVNGNWSSLDDVDDLTMTEKEVVEAWLKSLSTSALE